MSEAVGYPEYTCRPGGDGYEFTWEDGRMTFIREYKWEAPRYLLSLQENGTHRHLHLKAPLPDENGEEPLYLGEVGRDNLVLRVGNGVTRARMSWPFPEDTRLTIVGEVGYVQHGGMSHESSLGLEDASGWRQSFRKTDLTLLKAGDGGHTFMFQGEPLGTIHAVGEVGSPFWWLVFKNLVSRENGGGQYSLWPFWETDHFTSDELAALINRAQRGESIDVDTFLTLRRTLEGIVDSVIQHDPPVAPA